MDDVYEWAKSKSPCGSSSGLGYEANGGNRALGQRMADEIKGWTGSSWTSLDNLWTRESQWNHTAENPSSGAYGIPQALPGDKMASHGADWRTNPATQIAWGLDYIAGRYGDPNAAWAHSQSVGWYHRGGVIPGRGEKLVLAQGGERVLPESMTGAFDRLANSIELWSSRGAPGEAVGSHAGQGGRASVQISIGDVHYHGDGENAQKAGRELGEAIIEELNDCAQEMSLGIG